MRLMVTDWTWGREFGRVVVVVLAERAETKPGNWLALALPFLPSRSGAHPFRAKEARDR
jgi:hypothetical protein